MRAILIDPHTQTIGEAEHAGGLESLYRLLDCASVDAIHINGDISNEHKPQPKR